MFDWINRMLGLLLDYRIWSYWLPVAVCLLGYLLLSVEDYHKDIKERDEADAFNAKLEEKEQHRKHYYNPTITIGLIVGRFIVSFIPLINVLITVFKFLPRIAKDIIDACGRWLDIPLVPKRNK